MYRVVPNFDSKYNSIRCSTLFHHWNFSPTPRIAKQKRQRRFHPNLLQSSVAHDLPRIKLSTLPNSMGKWEVNTPTKGGQCNSKWSASFGSQVTHTERVYVPIHASAHTRDKILWFLLGITRQVTLFRQTMLLSASICISVLSRLK